MDKVTPFLWYVDGAEEAARLYASVLPRTKITSITPGAGGEAMSVELRIDGRTYLLFNGGPMYQHTAAYSMYVDCVDQAEVDRLWDALFVGSDDDGQCGWRRDRFGVWWQIVPRGLSECIARPGGMHAMLGMKKLDIAALRRAAGLDAKASKTSKAKAKAKQAKATTKTKNKPKKKTATKATKKATKKKRAR